MALPFVKYVLLTIGPKQGDLGGFERLFNRRFDISQQAFALFRHNICGFFAALEIDLTEAQEAADREKCKSVI
jgi:hypothetical protein